MVRQVQRDLNLDKSKCLMRKGDGKNRWQPFCVGASDAPVTPHLFVCECARIYTMWTSFSKCNISSLLSTLLLTIKNIELLVGDMMIFAISLKF